MEVEKVKEMGREELHVPDPDIHELFCHYNALYFDGALAACSPTGAPPSPGTCYCYYDRGRFCEIRLSEALRKIRPTTSYKNVLLHEMIHAFLWVKYRNKDHSDHGSHFHEKMKEINCSSVVDHQKVATTSHLTMGSRKKSTPTDFSIGFSGFQNLKPELPMSALDSHNDMAVIVPYLASKCDTCGHIIKKTTKPSATDCKQKVGPDGSCNSSKCDWHIHKNGCSGSYTRKSESPRYEDDNLDSKGGQEIQDGKHETFSDHTGHSTRIMHEKEGSKEISEVKKMTGIENFMPMSNNAKGNSVDVNSSDDNCSKEFSRKQAKSSDMKTPQNPEGVKSPEFKREDNTFKKERKSPKELCPVDANFFALTTQNHARARRSHKGVKDVASKTKSGRTVKKRTRDGKLKEGCTAVSRWREWVEAYKAAGGWFSMYGDEEECDDVEPLKNKRSERKKRLKLLQSCCTRISISEEETDDADQME